MFAVVAIGSKQLKVSPGDTIEVDRVTGNMGEVKIWDQVLMVADKGEVRVGTPLLKDVQVETKIIAHRKGDKLDVYRFKAKARHRRHIGFRPFLTSLEVVSIKAS